MIANIDPDNGTAYGYISANALDSEVVDSLMERGQDLNYTQALAEHLAIERRDAEEKGNFSFDAHAAADRFSQEYECEEPIVEGEIAVDRFHVHYRSSWLGGALHFFIMRSPFVTFSASRASPCVPNAGILDTLDGDVIAYDVPADWRAEA